METPRSSKAGGGVGRLAGAARAMGFSQGDLSPEIKRCFLGTVCSGDSMWLHAQGDSFQGLETVFLLLKRADFTSSLWSPGEVILRNATCLDMPKMAERPKGRGPTAPPNPCLLMLNKHIISSIFTANAIFPNINTEGPGGSQSRTRALESWSGQQDLASTAGEVWGLNEVCSWPPCSGARELEGENACSPAPPPGMEQGQGLHNKRARAERGRVGTLRAHQCATVLNPHAPRGKCWQGPLLLLGGECPLTGHRSVLGAAPWSSAAPGSTHRHPSSIWSRPGWLCCHPTKDSFPSPLPAWRTSGLTLSPRHSWLCCPHAWCAAELSQRQADLLVSGPIAAATLHMLCASRLAPCFSVPLDLVTKPLSYQVTGDSFRGRLCSAGDLLGTAHLSGCFPEPPDPRLCLST